MSQPRIVAKNPNIELVAEILEAEAALDSAAEKHAQLLGGPPEKDRVVPGGGWLRVHPGADIYWSKATGAHEVHGDIRAKYDLLGGAKGELGLPLTDEMKTPDRSGRYNHFQGGSIYWTDHTGPMMVRGAVRDEWAAQGWEAGWLGYPVRDQHALRGLKPDQHPNVAWTVFENGAIVATKDGRAQAQHADVSAKALRRLVRRFFDERFTASPDNVGLHPPVELVNVSEWGYGLWASKPRVLSFALHGFHDNGLSADTNFKILVDLSFQLVWSQALTEPASKSLAVTLEYLRVVGENNGPLGQIPAGKVISAVTSAIHGAFFRGGPDPADPAVPDGSIFIASFPTGANQTGDGNIDVIDVMATKQGGLMVLVNPLPADAGLWRRNVAQQGVDAIVG